MLHTTSPLVSCIPYPSPSLSLTLFLSLSLLFLSFFLSFSLALCLSLFFPLSPSLSLPSSAPVRLDSLVPVRARTYSEATKLQFILCIPFGGRGASFCPSRGWKRHTFLSHLHGIRELSDELAVVVRNVVVECVGTVNANQLREGQQSPHVTLFRLFFRVQVLHERRALTPIRHAERPLVARHALLAPANLLDLSQKSSKVLGARKFECCSTLGLPSSSEPASCRQKVGQAAA